MAKIPKIIVIGFWDFCKHRQLTSKPTTKYTNRTTKMIQDLSLTVGANCSSPLQSVSNFAFGWYKKWVRIICLADCGILGEEKNPHNQPIVGA